jgi:hypothetical protein
MARGWESKAVESQVESARNEKSDNGKRQKTPAQLEAQRRRQVLLLSRARVVRQIETSSHPRYIDQLNQALADLDAQIADLDASSE